MKKVLFASAALIALATTAQAAEPVKLNIGGYMNQWVGYASNKSTINGGGAANQFSSVDSQNDIEISFKGSTKLDNGLTVAVQVDTNGSQGPTTRSTGGNKNGKRSFLTASGVFGAAMVGEVENVGALIHTGSPEVGGIGGQDGNWQNWVVRPTNHADINQRTYAFDDVTANKVVYVTPAFYGVQAGVSYTPSITSGGSNGTGHTSIQTNNAGTGAAPLVAGDLVVYGLAYNGAYNGVTVKADIGSGIANTAGLSVYQGGLQVGYAGFTVGGSALRRSVGSDDRAAKNGLQQGDSWDLGASYTTGPYSVSLTYFEGEATSLNSYSKDSENVWTLGSAYDMGAGVVAKASLFRVKWDAADNTLANKNEGWGAVTGLNVAF